MTIDCQVVHVCGIHEKQEHPSFRRILSILSLGQTLSCIPRQAIEFFFGELHRSLQGSEAVVLFGGSSSLNPRISSPTPFASGTGHLKQTFLS